ncbi:hypothetical protein PFISCL1PPCAC_26790, partial [Pristionchus fissidentatus]
STKWEVMKMMEKIKDALNTIISREEWMDEKTRQLAQFKLSRMLYYAGNRDWIDNDTLLDDYHSGLNISIDDSLDQMLENINRWKSDGEYLR